MSDGLHDMDDHRECNAQFDGCTGLKHYPHRACCLRCSRDMELCTACYHHRQASKPKPVVPPRQQIMRALDWMLEEAQCYPGAKPIADPHEAARRITQYFDELKAHDPVKYATQVKKALNTKERT